MQVFAQQRGEVLVTQLPGGCFNAEVRLFSPLRDIGTCRMQREFVLARQAGNKLGIGVRLSSAEFVIEVNDRKENSELRAEFQEKP